MYTIDTMTLILYLIMFIISYVISHACIASCGDVNPQVSMDNNYLVCKYKRGIQVLYNAREASYSIVKYTCMFLYKYAYSKLYLNSCIL